MTMLNYNVVMLTPKRTTRGFTIVELLIVVVIIAILAAITLVTYNGVQRRATNAAITDAASKTYRLLLAYMSTNGTAPYNYGTCVTVDSGCAANTVWSGSATFSSSLDTIGTAPRSVPFFGSDHYGILYYYNGSRMVDGILRPVAVVYWLNGTGQACGLTGIIADPNATSTTTTTAAYTAANDSASGKTLCAVSVPGPN